MASTIMFASRTTYLARALRWTRRWRLPLLILGLWFGWLVAVLLHGNGANVAVKLELSKFDYRSAAEFGEAFGSLSSFMAALAAAGAWYAVGQARRQAFETTFYNLMDHLNQIVTETDIQGKRSVRDELGNTRKENTQLYRGRDAFQRMVRNARLSIAGTKNESEIDRVVRGWQSFHNKYKNDLAHYFRTLYHIMNFIDQSKIEGAAMYAKILRAELSDSEQILLMYNCSVGKGRAKFKHLGSELID